MEYSDRHTYLFKAGKWRAIGTYFDAKGFPLNVVGESLMEIQDQVWTLKGFMELQLDEPVKIFNRYLVKPFDNNKDYTTWISDNPVLGKLKGQFTVVNDTILSLYRSEDGKYSGSEVLLFIDEGHYQNWGAAYENDRRMSSWEVMLERSD